MKHLRQTEGTGENMGSKRKQTQMEQLAYFGRQLKDRLFFLFEKMIESPKINKDTIVKKLRANIRAVNGRLNRLTKQRDFSQRAWVYRGVNRSRW